MGEFVLKHFSDISFEIRAIAPGFIQYMICVGWMLTHPQLAALRRCFLHSSPRCILGHCAWVYTWALCNGVQIIPGSVRGGSRRIARIQLFSIHVWPHAPTQRISAPMPPARYSGDAGERR